MYTSLCVADSMIFNMWMSLPYETLLANGMHNFERTIKKTYSNNNRHTYSWYTLTHGCISMLYWYRHTIVGIFFYYTLVLNNRCFGELFRYMPNSSILKYSTENQIQPFRFCFLGVKKKKSQPFTWKQQKRLNSHWLQIYYSTYTWYCTFCVWILLLCWKRDWAKGIEVSERIIVEE